MAETNVRILIQQVSKTFLEPTHSDIYEATTHTPTTPQLLNLY